MPTLMSFSKELGIDLGTTQTRIADNSGVLMDEPTIVAIVIGIICWPSGGTVGVLVFCAIIALCTAAYVAGAAAAAQASTYGKIVSWRAIAITFVITSLIDRPPKGRRP